LCYTFSMQPQTFIFFGPSGSGKGTQASLLQEELKKKNPERKILYIETGKRLREFVTGTSLTAEKVKEALDKGELVPEFVPVYLWTQFLIENFSREEHLFFDGSPRKLNEAKTLDSAIRFYKIENPTVISIEVSNEWATKLLKGRGRSDDNEEEIKNRLDWYEKNVVPAIEYFKDDPYYKFISINGEQTIEEVHKEIMEKVGL
jgi:adenylate kinase